MDNLNVRGKNMPRRKKKIVRNLSNSIKKTELGTKYNNLVNQINTLIITFYEMESNELYTLCKDHILDKLEEFGDSIESYDLLKKSIYSYKEDIKYDRLEFAIYILLNNTEHPYQFKLDIYDTTLVKNFDREWIEEVPFNILNELYTLLNNITK